MRLRVWGMMIVSLGAAEVNAEDECLRDQLNALLSHYRPGFAEAQRAELAAEQGSKVVTSDGHIDARLEEYLNQFMRTQSTATDTDRLYLLGLQEAFRNHRFQLDFEDVAIMAKRMRLDDAARSGARFVGARSMNSDKGARDVVLKMLHQLVKDPGPENLQKLYRWTKDPDAVHKVLGERFPRYRSQGRDLKWHDRPR